MTLLQTRNSFCHPGALGRPISFFAAMWSMAAVHQASSHFKRVVHLARLSASPSRNNVWGGNIWMLSPGAIGLPLLPSLHRDRGCTNQRVPRVTLPKVRTARCFVILWSRCVCSRAVRGTDRLHACWEDQILSDTFCYCKYLIGVLTGLLETWSVSSHWTRLFFLI